MLPEFDAPNQLASPMPTASGMMRRGMPDWQNQLTTGFLNWPKSHFGRALASCCFEFPGDQITKKPTGS